MLSWTIVTICHLLIAVYTELCILSVIVSRGIIVGWRVVVLVMLEMVDYAVC